MPFVMEVQVKSQGFPGAPGFTNLYFGTTVEADHQPIFAAVRRFMDDVSGYFPSLWSCNVQPAARIMESTTGLLATIATVDGANQATVQGDGGAVYGSGVSGAAITWLTATLGPRRVIRGRTFFVPGGANLYASDGTILPAQVAVLNDGAGRMLASAPSLSVWHRPKLGVGGVLAPVVSWHVTPTAVFLSSRRS